MNGREDYLTIVDIRIPFWRLVAFFIKSALAVIPAAIFLSILFAVIGGAIGYLLGMGQFGSMMQRWSF